MTNILSRKLAPTTLLNKNNLENKIILIRNILTCFLVAVVLITFISNLSFTPNAAITVNADGDYVVAGTTYKPSDLKNETFGGIALKFAYWTYGALTPNSGLLKINTGAGYWSTVETFYNALSSIGAGLALLWCLLELIEKSSTGHITGEFMLQLGIKLTIAVVVISEGGAIAEGLIGFGNGILDELSTATAGGVSATDQSFIEVYEDLKKANIFHCLGVIINFIFTALFMIICTIVMYVMMAGRIIEVCVRYVFFPIGAADVFTHGVSSPGMRYMKRFAASILQGAGMYVVMIVGSTMMAIPSYVLGTAANPLTNSLFPLICGFAMIGAMLKVQTIMNDVVG